MRSFLTVLIATLCILGATSIAMALPFDSMGWVDPNFGDLWNSVNLTGTARYFFYWDNPDLQVTELDLQFEGDIFNLSLLTAGNFTVQVPSGWQKAIYTEPNNSLLRWGLFNGGGINSTQDPIIVDVNYTLLSASRYYYGDNTFAGEVTPWRWNEAQGANTSWSQKYILYGHGSGDYGSGGSTAPTPEPSSMLLLGMGILGIFGLRRKT